MADQLAQLAKQLQDVGIFAKSYGVEPTPAPEHLANSQLQWKTTLPPLFWESAIEVFAVCWALWICSFILSPLLFFGKSFPKEHKIMWHCTMVSVPMNVWITAAICPDAIAALQYMYVEGAKGTQIWNEYTPTMTVWRASGLGFGYMIYDLITMIVFYNDSVASLGKKMYKQLWIHHGVCLIGWPVMLCAQKTIAPFVFFEVAECTSIFLNISWICERMGWKAPLSLLRICFLLSYTCVRAIPLSLISYYMLQPWLYVHHSPLQIVAAAVCCGSMIVLNFFWYYLILKKLWKVISGKGSLKDKVQDSDNQGSPSDNKKKQ